MPLEYEQTGSWSTRIMRRYRAARGDGLPFYPFGALPLAGLVLLTLFSWIGLARSSVEDVARSTAVRALAEAGEAWALPKASGQWIILEGVPPTPEAGRRAIEAVRQAKAPTWLGPARPITWVRGNFGSSTAPPPASSALIDTTAPAGTEPPASFGFVFRLRGGEVLLDGRVDSEAARERIGARALRLVDPPRIARVRNNIEVANIAVPASAENIANRGLDLLASCLNGSASFENNQFSLSCEVREADRARLEAAAWAALPFGRVGAVELMATETIASCEAELERLLAATQIMFPPGSDALTIGSDALLDLTARAAIDCPGQLRVEGHTDNTGSLEFNDELSERRAEAVRAALIQRGVPPDRVIAVGFGSRRPAADNLTADGRARNRRIEIRIVRPGE